MSLLMIFYCSSHLHKNESTVAGVSIRGGAEEKYQIIKYFPPRYPCIDCLRNTDLAFFFRLSSDLYLGLLQLSNIDNYFTNNVKLGSVKIIFLLFRDS